MKQTSVLLPWLITCCLLPITLAAAAERPNVLLILVDDLKPALGCYGDVVAKTPNLDKLAARGMRFDLAYCNQAVCAPSRFTLMLGSHSTSTGLYGLGSQLREVIPDAVTMPQYFAKHGYRTESLGKVFHIGHGNNGDPESFSVPHFHDKVIEYLDPESTDGGKLTREEAYFTNQRLGEIKSLPRGAAFESPDVEDDAYADGRVAAETIKRLQAAKKRRAEDGTPFFIAAGFARPHLPFSAPKRYWDLYDPAELPMPQYEDLPAGAPSVAGKRGGEISNYKPVPQQGEFSDSLKRQLIHGYYASTSFVDAQIGKVFNELDRLQLLENTIVVLWGDHGFHLGDLGIWTKHTNYEQANRIPIVFIAPGVTKPFSSTKQLAESVDIFPTLTELAGLPAPTGPQPMDGVSLVPVLKDPGVRVRDHAFHAYPKAKMGRAIRTERYRLVQWKNPGDTEESAEYELYDYEADPLETKNLANSHGDVVTDLKSRLAAYPEPKPRASRKKSNTKTPRIANREIAITVTARATKPHGVLLAQGGREHGYAIHVVDGIPMLDVRRNGKVTRLESHDRLTVGKFSISAQITADRLAITVGDNTTSMPSPGLITKQPIDQLSIGEDLQSAAGDYASPNPFSGQVLQHEVLTMAVAAPDVVKLNERPGVWPVDKAWSWYDTTPWPVGANFVPSTAINQLEMWQADTFDPATIDRELGWAAEIGMNTMRVFLHNLAYKQDPDGFQTRVDQYLEIADRHGIRTMIVFFDGVWHPYPKVGKQPEPRPGLHNSGWVQSPGREILEDPARHDELKPYVQAVMQRYKDDPRVLIWDLFNEPDNGIANSYGANGTNEEMDHELKIKRAEQLLARTFQWAREVNPSQPLTCGVWAGDYLKNPSSIQRLSLEASDVISFHTYAGPDEARRLTEGLLQFGRPVICTEYLARGNGSTFESILPIFHEHKIGAYNWGLVDGKSQTIYPWDSWDKPYPKEPKPWHHDVFRRDGTPYNNKEVRVIGQLAKQPPTRQSKPPRTAVPPPREELESGLRTHDRALFVKAGWIRDPYISVGPDGAYYLTGTTPLPEDPRQQSDPYNTGLGPLSLVGWKARVWRSKDLIDWESLGTPFTLKDGVWAMDDPAKFNATPVGQWRLWAPELHWLGNRWALVHTSPAPVKGANLSLTNGADVAGPWENPMGAAIQRRHDPSLFKDDDGTWWMIWGATQIAPLKKDFSGFASKPITIGPSGETKQMGHEGCLMHKIGGKYVLFGTGWSTARGRRGSYNLYYATADEISGPYSERQFAGRFLGHGTPFQDRQGRWWCTAFFNANVPPLSTDGIETRDLSHNAQTINQQGVTLVPLDVRIGTDGEPIIRAKDPHYANPGPDEAQKF